MDTHAPQSNVHDYALHNGIEIVEVHLRAEREFTGTRKNKALDASLTVKARLQELAAGRIQIDAHNLLCHKPPCKECGTPLPLRKVEIRTKDCWKCGQNVNVAIGRKDDEDLWPDLFAEAEIEFAKDGGVTLVRRFSATLKEKYLANVCTGCDQMQGNWFLYSDPYHDRFNLLRTERQAYGPCDECATRYCPSHDEYLDYSGTNQCPACLGEAERVMCPNSPQRECLYSAKCEKAGCYFVNREQQPIVEQQEWDRQQQEIREEKERKAEEERERNRRKWADMNDWISRQSNQ